MTVTLRLRNGRLLDGSWLHVTALHGVITHVETTVGPRSGTDDPDTRGAHTSLDVFGADAHELAATLEGTGSDASTVVLDLGGRLVMESMVEPHAHVDKAFSVNITGTSWGSLEDAVASFETASLEGRFIDDERVASARKALLRYVAMGVGVVRTHVDVGVETSLDHLSVVRRAFAGLEHLLTLQTVALAYNPIIADEGSANRLALQRALSAGAHLVGGVPQFSTDPRRAMRTLLDMAQDADVPVDLHLDETLDSAMFLLPDLCREVDRRGLGGFVTASHCVSLSSQSLARQVDTAIMAADVGVALVVLPQTNLFLQARQRPVDPPRGIAPLSVLRQHGVVTAVGGDNVRDPFNPLGSQDPLEAALLCVYAAHQSASQALHLVSSAGQQLTTGTSGFVPGGPMSMVIFDADSALDLLARANVSRVSIRQGRAIARTRVHDDLVPTDIR